MRQAKQRRADTLSERAQQMATARSDQIAHDINRKTNDGLMRAQVANREMLKQASLDSSVLGRQGKVDEMKPEPKYAPVNAPVPRDYSEVDRSIVGKRKTQRQPNPEYADSLAPNQRAALKYGRPVQRNDVQPRFHPSNANDERPNPNETYQPRRETQTNHLNAGEIVRAHGININPIAEARRRKALEAHIRERANAGK